MTLRTQVWAVVVFVYLAAAVAWGSVDVDVGQPSTTRGAPVLPGAPVQIPLLAVAAQPPQEFDYRQLCEGPIRMACEGDRECAAGPRGRQSVCKKAKGWDVKACLVTPLSRSERDAVRSLIGDAVRAIGGSRDLIALMRLVALRESTYQHWPAHRLNPDVEAARKAYNRLADRYRDNPHHGEIERWPGWGLYGQNAPLWVFLWDVNAAPEVLCHPVIATWTYVRRLRQSLAKARMIMCDGVPVPLTWETIHRAASSGGKYCVDETWATKSENFRRRARAVGLDPEGIVTAKMLGKEPPGDPEAAAWAVWVAADADLVADFPHLP